MRRLIQTSVLILSITLFLSYLFAIFGHVTAHIILTTGSDEVRYGNFISGFVSGHYSAIGLNLSPATELFPLQILTLITHWILHSVFLANLSMLISLDVLFVLILALTIYVFSKTNWTIALSTALILGSLMALALLTSDYHWFNSLLRGYHLSNLINSLLLAILLYGYCQQTGKLWIFGLIIITIVGVITDRTFLFTGLIAGLMACLAYRLTLTGVNKGDVLLAISLFITAALSALIYLLPVSIAGDGYIAKVSKLANAPHYFSLLFHMPTLPVMLLWLAMLSTLIIRLRWSIKLRYANEIWLICFTLACVVFNLLSAYHMVFAFTKVFTYLLVSSVMVPLTFYIVLRRYCQQWFWPYLFILIILSSAIYKVPGSTLKPYQQANPNGPGDMQRQRQLVNWLLTQPNLQSGLAYRSESYSLRIRSEDKLQIYSINHSFLNYWMNNTLWFLHTANGKLRHYNYIILIRSQNNTAYHHKLFALYGTPDQLITAPTGDVLARYESPQAQRQLNNAIYQQMLCQSPALHQYFFNQDIYPPILHLFNTVQHLWHGFDSQRHAKQIAQWVFYQSRCWAIARYLQQHPALKQQMIDATKE